MSRPRERQSHPPDREGTSGMFGKFVITDDDIAKWPRIRRGLRGYRISRRRGNASAHGVWLEHILSGRRDHLDPICIVRNNANRCVQHPSGEVGQREAVAEDDHPSLGEGERADRDFAVL